MYRIPHKGGLLRIAMLCVAVLCVAVLCWTGFGWSKLQALFIPSFHRIPPRVIGRQLQRKTLIIQLPKTFLNISLPLS
ncbi:hypothetical protein CDV31_000388 [Fusarium ambrosium]|uniref:Uncharacterized protein n=1 Tax=Fusarium ambrosium TaxID=131363 RepID=A0A428V2F1_9HYPO|nr:hypothetical protein CDV31_000388 [Fusarium ambrosium]